MAGFACHIVFPCNAGIPKTCSVNIEEINNVIKYKNSLFFIVLPVRFINKIF